jgi:hypothetical protein
MQVTLKLERSSDLDVLLPLFKRMGVSIMSTSSTTNQGAKIPLSKHLGVLPNLDIASFDNYLVKSRAEWDRDIF